MQTSLPVQIKELEQKTAKTGSLYIDIKTSEGKRYRMFDPGVCDAAIAAYQNQKTVVLTFIPGKANPNGGTYRPTVKNITPAEQNIPTGHPFPSSVRPVNAPNSVLDGQSNKDSIIARQVALKAAVELCASGRVENMDNLLPLAEDFHKWLMK